MRLAILCTLLASAGAPCAWSAAAAQATGAYGAAPQPFHVVQPVSDADLLTDQLRALAANPRDLWALTRAADLSTRLGDLNAAMAFVARGEAIDPRSPRLKAIRGAVLVRLERPGEALRLFAEAASLGADIGSFASDRGLAYDLIGQQERAQRDYRMALRRGSDDETRRRYALSLGISGRREEALAQIDPLLRQSDRGAWRVRAFILAMAGDVSGADRIAASMMSPGMAAGLRPFLQRLPTLTPADRAFAVHFGEVHSTPARIADARMTPPLGPLGPDADAPTRVAAAQLPRPLSRAEQKRAERAAKNAEREAKRAERDARRSGRTALASIQPTPRPASAAPPLPPPPGPPVALADNAFRPPAPYAGVPRPIVPPSAPVPARSAAGPPAPPSPYRMPPGSGPAIGGAANAPVPAGASVASAADRPAPASPPARGQYPATLSADASRPTPASPAAGGAPAVPASPAMASIAPTSRPSFNPPASTPNPAVVAAASPPGAASAGAPAGAGISGGPAAGAGAVAPVGVAASAGGPASGSAARATPVAGTALGQPVSTPPLSAATLPAGSPASTGGAAAAPGFTPASSGWRSPAASAPVVATPAAAGAASAEPSPAARGEAADTAKGVPTPDPTPAPREVAGPPAPTRDFARDDALAAIVGGIAIPGSELGVPPVRPTPEPAPAEPPAPVAVAPSPQPATPSPARPVAEEAPARSVEKPAPAREPVAKKVDAAKPTAEKKAKEEADAKDSADRKLADKKLADKKAADQKAADQKLADKKAADKKAADKKLADKKAADKKAAAKPDPAKGEPARYWVQVAGGANADDLDKAWVKIRDKAPELLRGRQAWRTPLRATNRLLTGPFKTGAEAQDFVNRLAKAGLSGFSFQSAAGQKVEKIAAR